MASPETLACTAATRRCVCRGPLHHSALRALALPAPAGQPSSGSLVSARAVQVQAYLEAYADRFDLRPHICFDSAVTSVQPLPRESDGGTAPHSWPQWGVTVQPGPQVRAVQLQAGGSPLPSCCWLTPLWSLGTSWAARLRALQQAAMPRSLCPAQTAASQAARRRAKFRHGCRAQRPTTSSATRSWSATATTRSRACQRWRGRTPSQAGRCTATTTARARPSLGSACWWSGRSPPASTSAGRSPRSPSRHVLACRHAPGASAGTAQPGLCSGRADAAPSARAHAEAHPLPLRRCSCAAASGRRRWTCGSTCAAPTTCSLAPPPPGSLQRSGPGLGTGAHRRCLYKCLSLRTALHHTRASACPAQLCGAMRVLQGLAEQGLSLPRPPAASGRAGRRGV